MAAHMEIGAVSPDFVEFMPEPRDYVALNTLLARRNPMARFAHLLLAAFVAMAAAVAIWATFGRSRPGWPVAVGAFLGFAAGWFLPTPLARLQAFLVFRGAAREGQLVGQRLELLPLGLRVTSRNGETLTRWPAVKEVVRTEDHVFFFIASRTAFLAPRRAFADANAFDVFCQRVQTYKEGVLS